MSKSATNLERAIGIEKRLKSTPKYSLKITHTQLNRDIYK